MAGRVTKIVRAEVTKTRTVPGGEEGRSGEPREKRPRGPRSIFDFVAGLYACRKLNVQLLNFVADQKVGRAQAAVMFKS